MKEADVKNFQMVYTIIMMTFITIHNTFSIANLLEHPVHQLSISLKVKLIACQKSSKSSG
jgi:hypothetical protein